MNDLISKFNNVTVDELRDLLVRVLITNHSKDESDYDYWIRIRALQLDYITFDMRTAPNTFTITDKGRAFLDTYNTNLTMSSI